MRASVIAVVGCVALVGAGCNRATAAGDPAKPNDLATPVANLTPAEPTRDAAAQPVAAAGPTASARVSWREATIPAGTRLPIVLDTPVGSDTSRVEQRVNAHLSRAVVVGGSTVVPSGSEISGVVTDARQSGKVKGRAHVAVRFDTLVPRSSGDRYTIRTAPVGRTAEAQKGRDALEILGPATGGAIIGRIAGGRKGALIGAGVGGGAGTAVVLNQRGKPVHLGRGTALTLRLTEPVKIRVAS